MINIELPEGFAIREEEDLLHLLYGEEEIASFSAYLEDTQVIKATAEAYLRKGNNG